MKKLLILGLIAAGGLVSIALVGWRQVSPPSTQGAVVLPAIPVNTTPDGATTFASDRDLLADAVAESDPTKQDALLAQWAGSIDISALGTTLDRSTVIQNPELRTKARAALLTSWSSRDLPGAVTWFSNRGGADQLHEQARDLLAHSMAERNPAAEFASMQAHLPESSRDELYAPFFRQWTQKSPAAAAQQLSLLTDSATDATKWNDLLGQVAAQWAHADLKQSLIWVQSLPQGNAKSSALQQMCTTWADADPQTASTYAAQQNDAELLKRVAGEWAQNDPTNAAAFAAAMPAGSARDAFTARLATIWAENDPISAAAYTAHLPAGNTQTQAAVGVVTLWAQTSPADTARWVAHFPEGPTRDQAIGALINAWSLISATDAQRWINNLPQGHSRDVAVSALGNSATP
jgi:hypothetical protein